ncbi:MAG: ABC transporter permease [Rhodobacteraceae bacterium]|jgi:peptide/nickel transport system permease protein|nr:ABC transporter permease [Paracoccaceae bacterium]
MRRQIATQLALSVISLFLVSALVFWLVDKLPGDTAELVLGQNATEEAVAVLRERLRLDMPLSQRYGLWLGDMLRGDLGDSIVAGRPVIDVIGPRLANSFALALLALAIYVPVGLGLALVTAVNRGRPLDTGISLVVLIGMSVPEFVIAIFLMIGLAVVVPVFPPLALIDQASGFWDTIYMLMLPALSLCVVMTAYAIRLMRESLIQILDSDYVRMAELKGLPPRRVLLRHVLPSALGPALSVTATNVAYLIGSVVLVEMVFNFPGIGRQLIESLVYKDFPVVQAISLILCSIYILANLVAEMAILLLNPRLWSPT